MMKPRATNDVLRRGNPTVGNSREASAWEMRVIFRARTRTREARGEVISFDDPKASGLDLSPTEQKVLVSFAVTAAGALVIRLRDPGFQGFDPFW